MKREVDYMNSPRNDEVMKDGVSINAAAECRRLQELVDYWGGYTCFIDDCLEAQELYEQDEGVERPASLK